MSTKRENVDRLGAKALIVLTKNQVIHYVISF